MKNPISNGTLPKPLFSRGTNLFIQRRQRATVIITHTTAITSIRVHIRDFLIRTEAGKICVRDGRCFGTIPIAIDLLGRISRALGGDPMIEEKKGGDEKHWKGTHIASRQCL